MERQGADRVAARSCWARRAVAWAPAGAYMAAIFYVSSLPNPAPGLIESFGDKTLHLAAYAGLAVLYGRAVSEERARGWTTLALAFGLASIYGATDEWHQMFVPGRGADVTDWLADSAGAAAGAGLLGFIGRR